MAGRPSRTDDTRWNSPCCETTNGVIYFVSFIGLARARGFYRGAADSDAFSEATRDLSVIIENAVHISR